MELQKCPPPKKSKEIFNEKDASYDRSYNSIKLLIHEYEHMKTETSLKISLLCHGRNNEMKLKYLLHVMVNILRI